MEMFDICGKVAIVTGGASGIGLATVEQLLKSGIRGVTIADINEELGQKAAENFSEEFGSGKVLFVKLNVTDRNEFKDVFAKTIAVFQNLDILINSAAICNDYLWEDQIAINLGGTVTGTYLAFEEFLPKHRSGSEGVVINFSSIGAIDIFASSPVYSATKAAVLQFSRGCGSKSYYDMHRVRVMAVCPGYTDTPLMDPRLKRCLNSGFRKLRKKLCKNIWLQPSAHVAKCIISMIREGENGSAWVIENNEIPYQLRLFPCRKDSKN